MRFSAQPRGEDAKLQMASMIDIVFLLLIFFLVGTKFRVPEGELDAFLPKEGAGKPTDPGLIVEEIHVTLKVASGGRENPAIPPVVFLDDERVSGGLPKLQNLLEDKGRRKRPGTGTLVGEEVPVIIEAEPDLPYRWVIETLNMC